MTRRRTECTLLQRLKLKRLAEELLSDAHRARGGPEPEVSG